MNQLVLHIHHPPQRWDDFIWRKDHHNKEQESNNEHFKLHQPGKYHYFIFKGSLIRLQYEKWNIFSYYKASYSAYILDDDDDHAHKENWIKEKKYDNANATLLKNICFIASADHLNTIVFTSENGDVCSPSAILHFIEPDDLTLSG